MSREVTALLKQREDAESSIKRAAQARKLAEHPDFRDLILKEFCVNECARYAQLSQDPSLSAAAQADSLNIAQSAGHFRRWLSVVIQMGDHAQGQIESIDDAITAARQEGGDE